MVVEFRQAGDDNVAAMTQIRARSSYDEEYWSTRIGGYLKGTYSPQQALADRAAFLAIDGDAVVGFRRRASDEAVWLRWRVGVDRCGSGAARDGIAEGLMQAMAAWFIEHGAVRVCVNGSRECGCA